MNPETPIPVEATNTPVTEIPPIPVPNSDPGLNKKKKLTLAGIIAVVIALLAGIGAAAYYSVILPNKPENKIALAFTNLAEQDQMTLKGKIDFLDKKSTSEVKGAAIDYNLKANLEKTLMDVSGKVGVNGAEFPYDARFVDQDVYLKVGGLSGLAPFIPSKSQEEAKMYDSLFKSINDQWYVIDRSFLQGAGASANCVADLSFAFTDGDVEKIEAAYEKYPLFSIKGSSEEEVDGTPVTKYELEPAEDKVASDFANELKSLSIVEKVKACTDDSGVTDEIEDQLEGEEDNTEGKFYAYITSDRKLKKLELSIDDDEAKVDMTMNFNFDDVEITKPDGAKPIQDILSNFLGAGSTIPEGGDDLSGFDDFEAMSQ